MKPEDMTLESFYEAFAKIAVPEGAPAEQHLAMRQAFFSGAATVLELELSSRDMPRPHQARLLDVWGKEVEAVMVGAARSI